MASTLERMGAGPAPQAEATDLGHGTQRAGSDPGNRMIRAPSGLGFRRSYRESRSPPQFPRPVRGLSITAPACTALRRIMDLVQEEDRLAGVEVDREKEGAIEFDAGSMIDGSARASANEGDS